MDTREGGRQLSGPVTAAAAYPRWVLLERTVPGKDPDVKTLAFACTSRGHLICVSFALAPPPVVSRLCLDLPDLVEFYGKVIAAHGDSVLIEVVTKYEVVTKFECGCVVDYFIYSAGNAAADPTRLPSLSLLPAPCYFTHTKQQRRLHEDATALLCRGDEELLVMELLCVDDGKANLWVLRSGVWELISLPVFHEEGKLLELSFWETDAVVPVGDRFLYWVDLCRGVIISDMSGETPELRYLSLPVDPEITCPDVRRRNRSVCATDGGGAVRFVDVAPRCCCGCPCSVRNSCPRSRNAFTVTTWMLRTDELMWNKACVVDCDELWALTDHGVVPHIRPAYPMVSLVDPDVLCYKVLKDDEGDHATWLVEVDTRRKELRSIFSYAGEWYRYWADFVPSQLSSYFNIIKHRRHEEIGLAPTAAAAAAAEVPVLSPEEMLATLEEIPCFVRDEMLRAYGVMTRDKSGFKFRCLLALPMDMRRNYCRLLIENCLPSRGN